MSSSWGPEEVRALRGGLSRAAFARRVGVTPHTVYRWELADDAKEARRPRGAAIDRLEALRGDRGASLGTAAAPAVARERIPRATPRAEDVAESFVGIERILRGDPSAGRADLLRIVTRMPPASIDARALAGGGLALYDVLLRSDARSALAAIAPVLVDAEDGRLSDVSVGLVHAVAACAHALPDATLFDAGRVHAHAARAEELSSRHGLDVEAAIAFLAWLATCIVAQMLADEELMARAFVRRDRVDWSALPPLLALHDAEARAVRAAFLGQHALAGRLRDEVAAGATAGGYALLLSRIHAVTALRRLDELGDIEGAIALARQSREIARTTNASPGLHVAFGARALGEGLFRAGRTAEALDVLGELASFTRETGLPPIVAVATMARVYFLTGHLEELDALARELRACEVPSLRAVCQVHAHLVEAIALLASSSDPEQTVEAFDQAAIEARGWNFLLREILVYAANAYLVARGEAETRAAIRRAQRLLDRMPSPWASAQLRRLEGALVAAHGDWGQARPLLESAIGTLEAGGDLADAAIARHIVEAIAHALGEPGAEARLTEASERVKRLGLRVPRSVDVAVQRFVPRLQQAATSTPSDATLEALVAPLQRLAVRGVDHRHLARELLAIAKSLLPGRSIRFEELGPAEAPSERSLRSGRGPRPDRERDARSEDELPRDANPHDANLRDANLRDANLIEWFEFGDGAGRTFRLGARAPLETRTRSLLTVLAITAGLAFELATLRGSDASHGVGAPVDVDADIPGLVAASPSMRALRAEVARLAASRATVVIRGESGTGKEVVARALHQLSTRAKGPYLAFNCAAVPRELFEGQLFGYRRGAFTGAVRDHPGVLGAADGGTIFLDEIGELPLDLQPKLLRFLENGEIFPLGEKRPRLVDVRVIAATHRDLAALVRDHRFREDLYYRLQVVVLRIAPLRERREDIGPLARRFLEQLSGGERGERGAPPVIAPDAMSKLLAHPWPGNVRELRNVIERALAYSPRPTILRAEHLQLGGGEAG